MSKEEVVSVRSWLEHHPSPKNDDRLERIHQIERRLGPDDGVVYAFDENMDVENNGADVPDAEYAEQVESLLQDALGG